LADQTVKTRSWKSVHRIYGIRNGKANIALRNNASRKQPWWRDQTFWAIAASISQVVAVALGAAVFYFTVIPLYSKAILEEEVAKQELALKQANAGLKASRAELREYAVKSFELFVSMTCSGLEKVLTKDVSAESVNALPTGLSVDPNGCLTANLKKTSAFRFLRPSEGEWFNGKVIQLGARLDLKRHEAITEYLAVPGIAATSPSALPPPGEFTKRLSEQHLFPQAETDAALLASRIQQKQAQITQRYFSDVYQGLFELQHLQWPDGD
jgi:hypothetical protein